MRTLIELYDSEMLLNLISQAQLEPDLVVFLYTAEQKPVLRKEILSSLIAARTVFEEYTPDTLETVLDRIEGNEIFADIHGGHDFAIAMISRLADERGYTLCYPGLSTRLFYMLCNGKDTSAPLVMPKLTVREIVEFYGGKVRDLPECYYDEYGRAAAEECLAQYRLFPGKWASFVKTLGAAGSGQKESQVWRTDAKFYKDYADVMEELPHVFDSFEIVNGRTELVFHDRAYQILVTDAGVPFEYDTYYQITDANAFDDVDLRVNIDWNGGEFEGGDPNSELDVVASKDGRLVSISCKAGKYDQQAIYEVKANADKFGGASSVPVLCADHAANKPEYVEKADELGVLLIEYEDMRNRKAADRILAWMESHP